MAKLNDVFVIPKADNINDNKTDNNDNKNDNVNDNKTVVIRTKRKYTQEGYKKICENLRKGREAKANKKKERNKLKEDTNKPKHESIPDPKPESKQEQTNQPDKESNPKVDDKQVDISKSKPVPVKAPVKTPEHESKLKHESMPEPKPAVIQPPKRIFTYNAFQKRPWG